MQNFKCSCNNKGDFTEMLCTTILILSQKVREIQDISGYCGPKNSQDKTR